MPVRVLVPELGESVVEATVGAWTKGVGDSVDRDEPIGELETDKITQEVTAFRAGTVAAILVPAGDTVPIGATIAVIAKPDESLSEEEARSWAAAGADAPHAPTPEPTAAPEPAPTAPVEPPPAAASPPVAGRRVRASPAVRRQAREMGVDLATIAGTGPGGRIRLADLDDAGSPLPAPAHPPAGAPLPTPAPLPPVGEGEEVERVPMSRSTRTMAKHMVQSVHTSPHFSIVDEVDAGETLAVYKIQKEALAARGVRLTLQAYWVRAAAAALREFPRMNASVDGDDIVLRKYVHVGMAASVGDDLVVPVVKHADRRDLGGLATAIGDLTARARDGKLTMDDITGGTFTITNAGMFGGPLMSAPIINQPQVGILGVHTITDRPVARGGSVVVRPMLYVSLSSDHRIVDGVLAVRFLNRVKELVEHPGLMATGSVA